jgi:hypothetical protein
MIHSTNFVAWLAVGWPGLIRVEINTDYPHGPWTVLADSLPNTGGVNVPAGEVPTDSCRIRVSTVGAEYSAISASDFAIAFSQGFLVMVRPNQPGLPVSSWDAGTVECPQMPADTFVLRNLGNETVAVFYPPVPTSGAFEERSDCLDQMFLPPGEMSACNIVLALASPDMNGLYRDTLMIATDASNQVGGFVQIPLIGHRVQTPTAPQVTLQMLGDDAQLTWSPVTQSINGCTMAVEQYFVYSSPSAR